MCESNLPGSKQLGLNLIWPAIRMLYRLVSCLGSRPIRTLSVNNIRFSPYGSVSSSLSRVQKGFPCVVLKRDIIQRHGILFRSTPDAMGSPADPYRSDNGRTSRTYFGNARIHEKSESLIWRTQMAWGVAVICLGACNDYLQLSMVRMLLGWFECVVTPGFLLSERSHSPIPALIPWA